ncbi:MAG: glutathione binding-like protein, partial [Hyphomicrobium sp.]
LCPKDLRGRTEVVEWLMWQMGGLGPMSGQANHFRNYAPEKIQYGIDRYTNELTRLYGVLDKQLAGRDFIANKYSIADIASYPWALAWERQGQDISTFPNVKAWLARIGARPGVIRGMATGKDLAPQQVDLSQDEEAQKILFGNRSKS